MGKMRYFSLPAPYETANSTVVAGPDGNFWFTTVAYKHFDTNQPSGAIGRNTHQGNITLFPLPSLNSFPREIVVGSDGKLWFTAVQSSGKVVSGANTSPGFE
jgi:streptogramin lyase